MIDPQQESSCTFDPNLQPTTQNPFDQGFPQESEPTFDKSTPQNNMFHSSNPFDVNYVPTGLEPTQLSPQPESSKVSLIQNISIYTTSRAQTEKHQEFRKIAYAPIDPDFNKKLQQELERQTHNEKENWQPDWTGNNQNSQGYSDSRQQPYYQSDPLESPQYSNQELNDTYEQGPEQDQGYEAQYESNADTQQDTQQDSVQDFVKNSIATFLQDPLASSMQALQCLSVQQQKELAQTLQVIQSIQPGLSMEMMPLLEELNANTNGTNGTNGSDRSGKNYYQKKNNGGYNGGYNGRNGYYNNNKFGNNEMQQNRVSNISTEKLVEIIEQNQINVISLLNEASTKIKKKIEYNVREIPMGRLKAFECACFLQKFKIGQKRGPSKQSAKTDASKEALLTLLSGNTFSNERMTIISIVQRMTGKNLMGGSVQPSKSYRANPHDFHINLLKGGEYPSNNVNENRRSAPMSRGEPSTNSNGFNESDPSVVELNNLGRQLNAKPIWNIKPIQETGEYEAQVTLQEETVKLVRPTKHDAMREAAFELLDKVKTKTEAEALLKRNLEVKMQTEKPKKELGSQGSEKRGGKRRLFESCIEDEFFNDLQAENQLSKEYMQKTNSEFELYLCSNIPKFQPNTVDTQIFYEVFDKLKDYTTTAVSEEKPELAEGEKHLTEYVNQYHLVPVGSFALECMRNEDPILDILFIFKELKEVNELDFLEIYRQALERSQNLKQEDEEEGECSTDTKFTFEIRTEEAGNYLEIQEIRKSQRPLKVRIFLSPLSQKEGAKVESLFLEKYNYSILHIKNVLRCFEDMESQLKDFRRLLLVLRAWRSTNNLEFLRTEILDIILLREFLNYKFTSFANPVINCLMVLNSEETIKSFLSQYDSYYMDYFLKLSEENKKELFEASKKTMSCIFNRNFKDAGLFREQQQ